MPNLIHYIHYNIHYCSGYQEFLEGERTGKSYKFNWSFFLLAPFWLILHKMYALFFAINFFYFNFLLLLDNFFNHNTEQTASVSAIVITSIHTVLTLYSHKMYHMHLENKFYKNKYNPEKCLKIVKPYPIYIIIPILLIMIVFTSFAFSYSYMGAKYIASLFH